MDRLSRWIDPLGQAETFSYDANGNLMSATDRKHQTSTFTYDALDRRTQAEYADGAVASFTFDTAGRLTQADDTADPHRPITLSYDPLDRLLTETTSLGTVSYQYDALGPRTSMTVSGQAPVTYTYDANSRLRTITQAPLNPADIQYDPLGRRTLLTLPNGVSTEYQYDAASRLTALIYRNALGPFGDLTYSYDANGNRTGVGGSWARSLLPEPIPSATYDAANRQLAFGGKIMGFDANGNLTTLQDGPSLQAFTWDARDRLRVLNGPSTSAAFAYDALGRRVERTSPAGAIRYRYDGLHVGIEQQRDGDLSLLHGAAFDELFRRGRVFYLADLLQSTVALSDEAGAELARYAYSPFGESRGEGAAESPVQYIGREANGTGLSYHRLRYYSPTLHRFISQDPLGLGGGDLNLYGYALNNPTTLRDFLGGPAVAPAVVWGVVVGKAIVGGISGAVGGYVTTRSTKGMVVGGTVGAVVGAATTPIASESAGALTAGALSSAAGQVAGNLSERKGPFENFSVLAVAGAGVAGAGGTTVTAVAVPRAAQAVANMAGAAVRQPQALRAAGIAGATAGIVTQGIIDGAFSGVGEYAGGKLQEAMGRGRPPKGEPLPWPLPPTFPFAP